MSQTSQDGRSRDASPARRKGIAPIGRRGIPPRSLRPTRQAEKNDDIPRHFRSDGSKPREMRSPQSAPKRRGGIRIVGRRGDPAVRGALIRYAAWLRQHYRFPVRVPVYLLPGEQFVTSEGKIAEMSFFAPIDRSEEPYIRIATGDFPSLKRQKGRDNALAAFISWLSHQIVHYWQWVETGSTSERGVESRAAGMLREYEKQVSNP